jgi:hypothetical protein
MMAAFEISVSTSDEHDIARVTGFYPVGLGWQNQNNSPTLNYRTLRKQVL